MAGSELGDISWYLDSNSGITRTTVSSWYAFSPLHFWRFGNKTFLKISVFTKLFEHFQIEIELGVKVIQIELASY